MFTLLLGKFQASEKGATALEYGLLVAGIAVAIIVIVGTLGDSIAAMFTSVNAGL